MKRKLVPSFIMLLAGAIASIVMYLNRYEIKTMLWILVAVLIFFYILGLCIKKVMDSFEPTEENTADEGSVIEKESVDEASEAQQGMKTEEEV